MPVPEIIINRRVFCLWRLYTGRIRTSTALLPGLKTALNNIREPVQFGQKKTAVFLYKKLVHNLPEAGQKNPILCIAWFKNLNGC
jgi:hypothetical protein